MNITEQLCAALLPDAPVHTISLFHTGNVSETVSAAIATTNVVDPERYFAARKLVEQAVALLTVGTCEVDASNITT